MREKSKEDKREGAREKDEKKEIQLRRFCTVWNFFAEKSSPFSSHDELVDSGIKRCGLLGLEMYIKFDRYWIDTKLNLDEIFTLEAEKLKYFFLTSFDSGTQF